MGAQQSKEEFLYQQVNYGNVEGIKSLRRDGASLEWLDSEGKTPLILACMRPDLINVAKVLIELGANVNAYRPGSHAGTALHHAAKRGLDQTVNLLLSSGANPFMMNDDCQTPLDLARSKGHYNVVRAMESRMCLFCGWMREVYGPSIIEAFAPQWVQRKIWVVVIPCDCRNPTMPQKFELAIYPDLQVAQPREVIQLWKVNIDEPKFNLPDPAIIIVDKASKTRHKFLSEKVGDKQQLQLFYNACAYRGLPQQVSHEPAPPIGAIPAPVTRPATTPPASLPVPEDVQLAMAINASIQSALAEGIPVPTPVGLGQSSGLPSLPSKPNPSTVRPSSSSPQLHSAQLETPTTSVPTSHEAPPALTVVPSAPPIDESFYSGPVHYPAIDSTPIDLKMPDVGGKGKAEGGDGKKDGSGGSGASSSSCVICLDAPVEGACIPCGHMAGCMSCLNEIKGKGWGCPVCRTDIDQVVRLYAV